MKIVIDIPTEFEEHFKSDRFEDSLQRVRFDIHKFKIGNKNMLSGNYEIETLDMLTEAFLNGTQLPKGHDRLIEAKRLKEVFRRNTGYDYHDLIDIAPTIVEADKENEE